MRRQKGMYRIVWMSLFLFVWSALLGCPITSLMSDRIVYGIEGEIQEHGSQKKVSSVKVKMSCIKSELDGQLETSSDDNGRFKLKGYGAPYDCVLIFDHAEFVQRTLRLDPAHREEPKEGFAWVWKVNVELEPGSSTR
jgi:hypothetical protein